MKYIKNFYNFLLLSHVFFFSFYGMDKQESGFLQLYGKTQPDPALLQRIEIYKENPLATANLETLNKQIADIDFLRNKYQEYSENKDFTQLREKLNNRRNLKTKIHILQPVFARNIFNHEQIKENFKTFAKLIDYADTQDKKNILKFTENENFKKKYLETGWDCKLIHDAEESQDPQSLAKTKEFIHNFTNACINIHAKIKEFPIPQISSQCEDIEPTFVQATEFIPTDMPKQISQDIQKTPEPLQQKLLAIKLQSRINQAKKIKPIDENRLKYLSNPDRYKDFPNAPSSIENLTLLIQGLKEQNYSPRDIYLLNAFLEEAKASDLTIIAKLKMREQITEICIKIYKKFWPEAFVEIPKKISEPHKETQSWTALAKTYLNPFTYINFVLFDIAPTIYSIFRHPITTFETVREKISDWWYGY